MTSTRTPGCSRSRTPTSPRSCGEAALRAERAISARARTLYFGGGTPSLLALEDVESIIEAVRREFLLPWGAEITLEANPGTLSPAYLAGLRDVGITRRASACSLRTAASCSLLGRIHTWQEAVESFEAARAGGLRQHKPRPDVRIARAVTRCLAGYRPSLPGP